MLVGSDSFDERTNVRFYAFSGVDESGVGEERSRRRFVESGRRGDGWRCLGIMILVVRVRRASETTAMVSTPSSFTTVFFISFNNGCRF